MTTLVEQIQQLRSMKFTSAIHDTFICWADATRRVDTCRRDEIANAINRHRTKNTSQAEKDRGFSLHLFAHSDLCCFVVHLCMMLILFTLIVLCMNFIIYTVGDGTVTNYKRLDAMHRF